MKKSWSALLVLMLALPAWQAFGQETPPDEPADATAADAAPADGEAAPSTDAVVDSIATDAAAESAPAETPPAEETAAAPAEEAPAEPGTPWRLYGGLDWVRDTLSASALAGFGQSNYDSGMYRGRLGARVFDAIGVEGQFGVDRSEKRTDTAETSQYYGLFLVPTASLFETIELAFPVGYARTGVKHTGGSATLSSLSYGINGELPLRVFSASMPDIRFVAGWMVYYQKVNARIYGLNAGLRYDFNIDGGNPFSGMSGAGDKIGGFFKGLWPFGKGDEAAPAQ